MIFVVEKKKPGWGMILVHTALVFLTGGLWLIPLIIRKLCK